MTAPCFVMVRNPQHDGRVGTKMSEEKDKAHVSQAELTEAEVEALRVKRQKMRSIAIAVGLVLLVVLFYVATIVRLGGNVLNRSI